MYMNTNPSFLHTIMYIFQLEQRISGKLRECGNTLKQLRDKIKQNEVTESETTNYTSCYETEVREFSPVHGTYVRNQVKPK